MKEAAVNNRSQYNPQLKDIYLPSLNSSVSRNRINWFVMNDRVKFLFPFMFNDPFSED